MKGRAARNLLTASAVCLLLAYLLVGPIASASNPAAGWPAPGQAYSNTSWALGVVVPEGAALANGGTLHWEEVGNVTAEFTLPNISLPDRTIYAVVSVMTDTGAVLQGAAGVRGNGSAWLAFSWTIPDVNAVLLTYHWILTASLPDMPPRSNVSISIFDTSGQWSIRVESTGGSVVGAFPEGLGPSLKPGDQEVFSLESYSRSVATFRGMGNLTLTSLVMDGARVAGGAYAYSEWDPNHSPLFVVGSSGASPPSFISVGERADGSFVWGYGQVWKGGGNANLAAESLVTVLLTVLAAVGLVSWERWKRRRRRAEPPAG